LTLMLEIEKKKKEGREASYFSELSLEKGKGKGGEKKGRGQLVDAPKPGYTSFLPKRGGGEEKKVHNSCLFQRGRKKEKRRGKWGPTSLEIPEGKTERARANLSYM